MYTKRVVLSVVLSIILMLTVLTGAFAAGGQEEITLSVWCFNLGELESRIERFEQMYPNIKVDLTVISFEELPHKMKLVIGAGINVPDVFTAGDTFVKDFVESGFYDDLSKAPYNADVSELVDYQVEMGTDSDGVLRAISWQATPGGFFYRRSIAKEYLGTDDPEEVGKMLSSWDKLLETGRLLKEKSNGKIKLISSYEVLLNCFLSTRKSGFVNDKNELVIDPAILEYFDIAKLLRDEGLTAKISAWSPSWFNGMKAGSNIFGYLLPTWGLHFILKENAPDSSGDWGLTNGPASYFLGGTWLGVYANSKNKEAAWKFVQMMTLDHETLKWWAKSTGDFIGNKVVINEIKDTFSEPYLNGQNHYAFFAKEVGKIDSSMVTIYDNTIIELMMGVLGDYIDGLKTKEEAIESFKDDVKNAYPDIIVR